MQLFRIVKTTLALVGISLGPALLQSASGRAVQSVDGQATRRLIVSLEPTVIVGFHEPSPAGLPNRRDLQRELFRETVVAPKFVAPRAYRHACTPGYRPCIAPNGQSTH